MQFYSPLAECSTRNGTKNVMHESESRCIFFKEKISSSVQEKPKKTKLTSFFL